MEPAAPLPEKRPTGLRLIIAYKFLKAPLSLSLAIALTFAPARAFMAVEHFLAQMSEFGSLIGRLAHWLQANITHDMTGRAAVLAWLDGSSTLIEGILLATGKAWAEWVVVAVLACLVPFEFVAFLHKQTPLRFTVMAVNILVVAYLAWRRIQAEREILHRHHVEKELKRQREHAHEQEQSNV